MAIRFIVPGQPIPAERPRVYRGRAFTPKRTQDYKERVAGAFFDSVSEWRQPLSGPVVLTVHFYRKDKRPCDLDNLAKSIQDALNKRAYMDDSQIVKLVAIKSYDKANPRVEVEIDAAS